MLTLTFDPNLKERVDKHSVWITNKNKLAIPETTNMLKIIYNTGS